MSVIFEESELQSGMSPQALQQTALQIKQRFDHRRAIFHQFRNALFTLETWSKFHTMVTEFDQKFFGPWNNKWPPLQQSPNFDALKSYFEEGNRVFQPLEEFIAANPIIISNDALILREGYDKNIETIDKKFDEMRQHINDEIKRGIDNLLALKGELALAKDFSANIISQYDDSVKNESKFYWAFTGSVFAYISIIVSSFFIKFIEDLNIFGQFGIRLSMSIPFAFFMYFLFNQYKFYKAASLKFGQLKNFLGGGITHLNQLLNTNQDDRAEINKKISEKFISIDDLIEMLIRTKTPIQEIDVAKSLKEIRDTVKELKETVKVVDPR